MATCETCRFFKAYQCHRNPPQFMIWVRDNQEDGIRGLDFNWSHPNVPMTDWCGEHQPKEQSHD